MSDIQLYLLEFDSNKQEAARIAANTSTKLETKELTLLDLIRSLDEFFNNDDGTIRAKTMAYLAHVLGKLPQNVLPRQHKELLNDFLLSRISHSAEGVGYCAKGLISLEKLGTFDPERVIKTVNTFLDETHPLIRFNQKTERFEILSLFDIFFSKYRKALQHLHESSKDFLSRLIAYLDGEKDPRNLMIVFSILNVPMVEWDVSNHTQPILINVSVQDLFEAVFDYFPITFRPPPDDPYKISAQDLKDRQRDCIASTALFAPYAFPALLDKLDSTSMNVKRDSFQAISACVSRYGPSTINHYSITLWDAVKFEILNAQEEDLTEESLNVLINIGNQLSSSAHEGPLQNYLKPICKECNEHFEDAPTKQSSASGRILGAVGKSSPEVTNLVVKGVAPQLLALYKGANNIPRKRGLLEVLVAIINCDLEMFGRWRVDHAAHSDSNGQAAPNAAKLRTVSNDLDDFSAQFLDILTLAVSASPVNEVSFRMLSLEGVKGLCLIRGLLDDESIRKVVQLLNEIVINETPYGKEEIKAASIDVLVEIAHQKPQLIVETAIPAFLVELPDTDVGHTKLYMPVLEAFAKLSADAQIFGTIVIRLKNKLYTALRQGATETYVVAILSALLYSFTNGAVDLSNPAVFGSYYQDIVMPLLKDVVSSGKQTFPSSNAIGYAVLDMVGRTCNVIVRSQPWVSQTEICRNIYTVFRSVDPSELAPFNGNSDKTDASTMIVSTHLIASLQREATPHTDSTELLNSLVRFSTSGSLPAPIRNSAILQVGLLVNKFVSPADFSTTLSRILSSDSPVSLIAPSTTTPTTLHISFTILKALILRVDPSIPKILPNFLSLLSDPYHGALAARAFSTLLAPDEFLTKPNHCRIFTLHKQRLFSLVAPALVSGFRNIAASSSIPTAAAGEKVVDAESAKSNHLSALSGMVQHVPYDLLRPELSSIAPLLLQSLALGDDNKDTKAPESVADVKAASIATLSKIVYQDPEILEQHVSSLITRLLVVATAKPAPVPKTTAPPASTGKNAKAASTEQPTGGKAVPIAPPKTRAAALACLASFVGSLRRESLIPYQRQVVRRLADALDDGRRAVRGEAVRCRAAWVGLEGDAAGEDSE